MNIFVWKLSKIAAQKKVYFFTFFGLLRFSVFFNGLFAPTSRSWMFNIFRDSESLGKSIGKKWSQIWTFLFENCRKSPRKKKFFSHFFTFEVPFNGLLPALPEVGCPKFLELRNPWGKVMERSGLTFEHFVSKWSKIAAQKKVFLCWFCLGPPSYGIGATIRIGQEMLCLLYAEFCLGLSLVLMSHDQIPALKQHKKGQRTNHLLTMLFVEQPRLNRICKQRVLLKASKQSDRIFKSILNEAENLQILKINQSLLKLDGVGPVDNRPSTAKLRHFVCKTLQELRKAALRVVGCQGVKVFLSQFEFSSFVAIWVWVLSQFEVWVLSQFSFLVWSPF